MAETSPNGVPADEQSQKSKNKCKFFSSSLCFDYDRSSGHDMIHRSMLIMYDQQSFMAMINDHSV